MSTLLFVCIVQTAGRVAPVCIAYGQAMDQMGGQAALQKAIIWIWLVGYVAYMHSSSSDANPCILQTVAICRGCIDDDA